MFYEVYEEGLTIAKARNALSLPQTTKQTTLAKTQNTIGQIDKHCTNYGMTNHNVETCKKKKQTIVATLEATQLSQKPQTTSSYACHICGLNGNKMINCPKFVEIQKMFHGMSQPHFGLSVRMKLTPKSGNLESSGTPKNSELDCMGQNTLHWGVINIIGKVLKCRCPKWPRMSHLDICSPSYGQKKGRESN